MAVIVDAGHGGEEATGRSSPLGAIGSDGAREKDLTLDLARRLVAALSRHGVDTLLTRTSDENLTLRERALTGVGHAVEAFVSLHFNAGVAGDTGSEVWVHSSASPACGALADALAGALTSATGQPARIRAATLGVLDPTLHRPEVAACLVEVAFLTDPIEEGRLRDPLYRQRLADAIAGALAAYARRASPAAPAARESFDVWHSVPLVQQLTGMSCWAAAAAMLVGWRECIDCNAEEVARGVGAWEAYRDGLLPSDVGALARIWGLIPEPAHTLTADALRGLLQRFGPLWVGEASPGLHVIVVVGIHGDGSPDGTFVRVNDPWPVGRGERYTITFRQLARNLDAASGLAGFSAQILRGVGRDPSRWN